MIVHMFDSWNTGANERVELINWSHQRACTVTGGHDAISARPKISTLSTVLL